ncbi:MAG: oligosaccharide flippase family protein [candidate division SR1 bacterium]|nr:oligosaccharide flippase family protein [candidate division SR1 bacterium]
MSKQRKIAKQLGPEQFGIMSFVISFVSMFIILTDFGLTTLMVREVSRDQGRLSEYFINGTFLKIILGIITFGIVRGISQFIGKPDFYITLILIYCGYSIINNIGEFIRAFFRPSEHMQYEALLKIINGIVIIIVIGGSLRIGYGLEGIFYAYLITGMISLFISIGFVLGKKAISNIATIKLSILISSIKSGFYLGLGNFFVSIYISIDQIILGYHGTNYDLGLYAFAYKITMIYAIVSSVVFSILLPKTAKDNYIKDIKKNYKRGLKKIAIYNTLIVIGIEIIIFLIYYFNIINFGAYRQSLVILMLLLIYCRKQLLFFL